MRPTLSIRQQLPRLLPAWLLLLLIGSAQAADSQDGEASVYWPSHSKTFTHTPTYDFQEEYAELPDTVGFIGRDVVALADTASDSHFGAVRSSTPSHSGRAHGILGLSFPLPRSEMYPLLYELVAARSDCKLCKPLRDLVFTTVMKEDGGELQLGGGALQSMKSEEAIVVPILPTCQDSPSACWFNAYRFAAADIVVAGHSLLAKEKAAPEPVHVLLDSGERCIAFPSSTAGNLSLLEKFQHAFVSSDEAFDIQILLPGGEELRIPSSAFIINGVPCIHTADSASGIVLGIPFFKQYVVVHDLRQAHRPRLVLAPHAENYRPAGTRILPASSGEVQLDNNFSGQLRNEDAPLLRSYAQAGVNPSIPLDTLPLHQLFADDDASLKTLELPIPQSTAPLDFDGIHYFASLEVGQPRQRVDRVLVDTGSAHLTLQSGEDLPPQSADTIAAISAVVAVLLSPLVAALLLFRMNAHRAETEPLLPTVDCDASRQELPSEEIPPRDADVNDSVDVSASTTSGLPVTARGNVEFYETDGEDDEVEEASDLSPRGFPDTRGV